MAQFAEPADRLHPAEGLLDELPFLLTEGVVDVPRGQRVDGAAALRRVLGDMRRRAHRAQAGDELRVS